MNNSTLVRQVVIENVVRSKLRGKVIYQGNVTANDALKIYYVKPYTDSSGKGYQRPVNKRRCKDFSNYLSMGEDALYTPILLNAGGSWDFVSYDNLRPAYGRLICNNKGSLMDGQHRLGGIQLYIQETSASINVPFLAFHWLDEDDEIMLFDTINTKAKGIGSSLSTYLRRDTEDLSWIATQMLINKESPFHQLGTLIGQRRRGKHITLQNVYKAIEILTKSNSMIGLKKEVKLNLAINYFSNIYKLYSKEWSDYKNYKITHIISINALSIVGNRLLDKCFLKDSMNIDNRVMKDYLSKIGKIDWSVNGPMRYLKGISGSRSLAEDIMDQLGL